MNTQADWIAAGAGFLAGVIVLGLITSLVVLIDIKVQLTQTRATRPRRRREDEEDA